MCLSLSAKIHTSLDQRKKTRQDAESSHRLVIDGVRITIRRTKQSSKLLHRHIDNLLNGNDLSSTSKIAG